MKINKENFIKDYNELTYEKLAEKYDVSRSTIRNLVKELNLTKPTGRKKKLLIKDDAIGLNFKIIGKPFLPKDRLNELESIPTLSDGNTDYWKVAQLLCEKDGGTLVTDVQLYGLARIIYLGKQKKFSFTIDEIEAPYKGFLNNAIQTYGFINQGRANPMFELWSSNYDDDYTAYSVNFNCGGTLNGRTYRGNDSIQALCVEK